MVGLVICIMALSFWLSWHAFEKWKRLQEVSWYKWCLLFLVSNVTDIHSTFAVISLGGQETNSVMVYFFDKIGVWWAILFSKGGAVVLTFAISLYLACRHDQEYLKLYSRLLFSISLMIFLVSLWNYSVAVSIVVFPP